MNIYEPNIHKTFISGGCIKDHFLSYIKYILLSFCFVLLDMQLSQSLQYMNKAKTKQYVWFG